MIDTKRTLAARLLEIGAVLLRPGKPFTWASGWHSPIYCDNRRILSHPDLRSWVGENLGRAIEELYPEAQTVAGVATGAIAHGVLAADRLGKPFIYVRSKPKDHGTGSSIEGELVPGSKVVVVEDLVSTGMSSLAAVRALREAGADVLGMVAIFTYEFPQAREAFGKEGVALHTLSCYSALLEEACSGGYISKDDLSALSQWRENPSEWGR